MSPTTRLCALTPRKQMMDKSINNLQQKLCYSTHLVDLFLTTSSCCCSRQGLALTRSLDNFNLKMFNFITFWERYAAEFSLSDVYIGKSSTGDWYCLKQWKQVKINLVPGDFFFIMTLTTSCMMTQSAWFTRALNSAWTLSIKRPASLLKSFQIKIQMRFRSWGISETREWNLN